MNSEDLIEVKWTPQVCLMLTKINIYRLIKTKKKILERLTTFDGDEKNVNSRPIISPLIASDIEKICQNIVRHIQDVSEGNSQIYEMNLFFKLDYDSRLWLLLCTGIKIREKKGRILDEKPEKKISLENVKKLEDIPMKAIEYPDEADVETILKTLSINKGGMMFKSPQDQKFCSNCLEENILYPVKMSHIFLWREKIKEDKIFVKIVKRVFGKDSLKILDKLVNDKNWLNVETRFCDECFLKTTKK